jgi:hypothetical protein
MVRLEIDKNNFYNEEEFNNWYFLFERLVLTWNNKLKHTSYGEVTIYFKEGELVMEHNEADEDFLRMLKNEYIKEFNKEMENTYYGKIPNVPFRFIGGRFLVDTKDIPNYSYTCVRLV